MKCLLGLGMTALVLPAQILTIHPAVVTDCVNGLGRATIGWSVDVGQRVQVRVGSATGTPMTGIENGQGWTRIVRHCLTPYCRSSKSMFRYLRHSGLFPA